ncbi:MAG: hypothetical protein ACK6D3_04625 [Planctomycetaceae bacterium]|jgi:hypothetical protein
MTAERMPQGIELRSEKKQQQTDKSAEEQQHPESDHDHNPQEMQ